MNKTVSEELTQDKDIELLTKVIEYNRERHLAFINGEVLDPNPDYEKILNARYCKVSRIKKRLLYLLLRCDYVWFCTFTFDNKTIVKSTRTKRDLIKSVLNTHDFKYILNIDYGKRTEREHYHCILGTNIDFNVDQFIKSEYPCFSCSIQCKKGREDYSRLSKYINKLTNHCIKATTKRQRLLYNFKGYENLDPFLKKLSYLLDRIKFFSEDVSPHDTLLDKGVISGKIEEAEI